MRIAVGKPKILTLLIQKAYTGSRLSAIVFELRLLVNDI